VRVAVPFGSLVSPLLPPTKSAATRAPASVRVAGATIAARKPTTNESSTAFSIRIADLGPSPAWAFTAPRFAFSASVSPRAPPVRSIRSSGGSRFAEKAA